MGLGRVENVTDRLGTCTGRAVIERVKRRVADDEMVEYVTSVSVIRARPSKDDNIIPDDEHDTKR